jgi:hypothetical protein
MFIYRLVPVINVLNDPQVLENVPGLLISRLVPVLNVLYYPPWPRGGAAYIHIPPDACNQGTA